VPDALFDEQFEVVKARVGVKQDVMLGAEELREIGDRFLQVAGVALQRLTDQRVVALHAAHGLVRLAGL